MYPYFELCCLAAEIALRIRFRLIVFICKFASHFDICCAAARITIARANDRRRKKGGPKKE